MIGALCTCFNIVLLWVQVEFFGFGYIVATGICFWVINFVGFQLNRALSFKATSTSMAQQAVKYYVVMLISLICNLLMMYLLVGIFKFHYLVSSLIVTCLFVSINFLFHRFWTFSDALVKK